MKIQVYKKRVYGVDRYYPANTITEFICCIKDRKTLTSEDMKMCVKWGFHVEVITERIP